MALKALLLAAREARITDYPNGTPAALVEILGAPLLKRIAEQLERCGIHDITVVTDLEDKRLERVTGVRLVKAATEELARVAERTFEDMESASTQGVVMLRADHYAEVDWQAVWAHHVHFRNRVTRIWTGDEPAAQDMYLVSAALRNEAASLLRSALRESRSAGVRYRVGDETYVRPLRDCQELQALVKDSLYRLNAIEPAATEVRPGIWVAKSARVEREARLVGPVFIGAHARVHGGAVVTRDSVLEHHTFVDCGSVLEDTHVQPYSAIGAGIDVTHAIVEGNQLYHLKRKTAFLCEDPKLLREITESAAARTAQAAVALLTHVPALVINAARKRRVASATCEAPQRVPVREMPRHNEDVAKLAPGLVVMRRYGNE